MLGQDAHVCFLLFVSKNHQMSVLWFGDNLDYKPSNLYKTKLVADRILT